MSQCTVRVALGVVHNLAVAVLLGNLFIDQLVGSISYPEQKINWYISSLLPILAINNLVKVHVRDCEDAQNVMTTKEKDKLHLVRVAWQSTILARSGAMVFVTKDTNEQVQIEALKEWNSIQA